MSNSENAPKKQIILNGFDMFTVGHMSFGQWRNPEDQSANKRRDLSYWTELAQLLERGDFHALFLADTLGWNDVYKGDAEEAVRTGTQFPMGDPIIPVTAMAAVTKNLGFAITSSTSFDKPYVLAKRFSTLDHLTRGRFGWNIVTSWKASGFQAIGIEPPEHDKRYEAADEFMEVVYKLWEGSWADDALVEDRESEIYSDFKKIRTIHHHGEYFKVDAPHILDPSPQRTPFLFQAGTSPAGIDFGARHAEGIFVVGFTPESIAPNVQKIRARALKVGRTEGSIKIFSSFTPIIGRTPEEAAQKYVEAKQYASEAGGLAYWCGVTHLDLSKFGPDEKIGLENAGSSNSRIVSHLEILKHRGDGVPEWTPRNIGKAVALGASGPVPVGTPEQIADEMERWIQVADLDGFNIGHITTPGTWVDVVELLVPELRKRGLYAPKGDSGTMRERFGKKGHSELGDDHAGAKYKWDVLWKEEQ